MYREILNQLADWKDKHNRKALLLAGGRGVGKSYTLRDFGEGFFDSVVIIDFVKSSFVKPLFADLSNKDLILRKLSISTGVNIVPGETFLVFDGVDVMDNAVDIVRFICEQYQEYHVAYTLQKDEKSFLLANGDIAANTDVINIYPLSFSEFLIVNKENQFCERISSQAKNPLILEEKMKLEKYLSLYLTVGGMPSVVKAYVDTMSMSQVESEKAKLLFAIEEDIDSIENAALKNKVKQVWASVPAQLEKDNKKFQYGAVKLTARAREYKEAVEWLMERKYVVPLYRAKQPVAPLSGQKDNKSFELFVTDIGLLVSLFGLTYRDIEESRSPFELKNGALTEQYIYEELLHNPNVSELYYWISEATARIEFMFEDSGAVIPMEINLDCNEKAQSLKVFKSRYEVPMAIRVTRDTINMSSGMLSLPLFSLWNL